MHEDVKLPGYITSVLAIIGGFVGGWLVKTGLLTTDQLPEAGGAALVGVTIIWRLYAKRVNRKALLDAVAAPAGKAKP